MERPDRRRAVFWLLERMYTLFHKDFAFKLRISSALGKLIEKNTTTESKTENRCAFLLIFVRKCLVPLQSFCQTSAPFTHLWLRLTKIFFYGRNFFRARPVLEERSNHSFSALILPSSVLLIAVESLSPFVKILNCLCRQISD